jgi:hypothetical protein
MANRLRVTELDFDTIKENLKNYLRQQTEFQDYDFEGSGLNILLDVLAYNTHYNAYYLNMVANESFLDTAILRGSVVSHAKSLGYVPHSRKPAVANVNISVTTTSADTTQSLTLPFGYPLQSNLIDNRSYRFNVMEEITVSRTGNQFLFENIPVKEGQIVNYVYTYNQQTNPKALFVIPELNVDTTSLKVLVQPSPTNSYVETYTLATDVLNVDSSSIVYFLQEGRDGKYEIYFGDDVIGKSIVDGSLVRISYLTTNGNAADRANQFIPLLPISAYGNIDVVVNEVASGSSERETVDSIKYSAPLQFTTQNRLVTYRDYESYIKKNYPSIDSVSVWGSEDDVPPSYGKVILSLKPKKDFYISELEKQRIIDEILKPKSIIAIQTEIRDPEYLYLLLNNYVAYDKRKTTDTEEQIKSKIRTAVALYRERNLNKFGGRFVLSKLQESVDDTNDAAIIGCETSVKLQKRFEPVIGETRNYEINFGVPLHRGTLTNRLTSTQFDVVDSFGVTRKVSFEESAETYTGIEEIQILNPGISYTSAPTVTITGDGVGATAEATIVGQRIEKITVTNKGYNYSRAVVEISGGGGSGGVAAAVITARTGSIRTIYYDADAQKQIVNENAGSINYDTGKITLSNLNVRNLYSDDSLMRLTIESEKGIVETKRNTVLEIDLTDSASVTVDLQELSAQ